MLLLHGQQEPKGSTHQFRASLVFAAFALEAYLNWLGQRQVPNWKYLDRLSPREKIEVNASHLGVKVDFGKRPWSIVTELFGFRNKLAHGKPEILEEATIEPLDDNLDKKLGILLSTKWEQFCTEHHAIRALEDVEAIATQLHTAAQFDHSESTHPFFMGFQSHSASLD